MSVAFETRPIPICVLKGEASCPTHTIEKSSDRRRRQASRFGSPGVPMYGYDGKIIDESTGEDIVEAGRKGVVVIEGPTPPGFMQTVWRDDARFVETYWQSIPGRTVYHASGGYRGEGKTDAKDAAVIADQARVRRDLAVLRPSDELTVELRILTSRRTDLGAERTRAINRSTRDGAKAPSARAGVVAVGGGAGAWAALDG